jgi:hypothetical protein
MKLANSATAAMTAEPMAKPLVTALVVLPTASRLTMMRSGSPWNSPDISAMPAALSLTPAEGVLRHDDAGGGEHAHAAQGDEVEENCRLPPPRARATPMAMAMAMTAYTELSRPLDVPESTTVAGPVSALSAISFTGAVVGARVVLGEAADASWASTRPMATAPKHFQPAFA